MPKMFANVLEAVGNTPLIRLNWVTEGMSATVCAKIEAGNPGRSVKDRIGLAMIEDAEKRGLLKSGGTIVEPTSANTGMALALVAAIMTHASISKEERGESGLAEGLIRLSVGIEDINDLRGDLVQALGR